MLVTKRRAYVTKMEGASGVEEKYGEFEKFLEFMISKNREKELSEEGEAVRGSSVKRVAESKGRR